MVYTGKLEDVLQDRVKFKQDGDMFGNLIMIDRIEYLYGNNTVMIYNGEIIVDDLNHYYVNSIAKKSSLLSETPRNNLAQIGGICIALAGALQYSTYLDTEKSRKASLEEFDDLLDSSINKGKLSAALFIIGGVLIAMDQ